jgi:hypothetical protein
MCGRLHLLVGAVILVLVPISSGQVQNSCRTERLPSPVQQLLDRKYGNWRPKDVWDLGADEKQLWVKAHPKDCPGIAIGHFEEPDSLAYAVLLVPKSELNNGYKIIIVSKPATGDDYTVRLLDANAHADSSSGLVISKASSGSYSDFEDTRSVQLKLDAVNVEWIEKAAVLYYWSHGEYHTIQTSD